MSVSINGVTKVRPELATHDTDIKADLGNFSTQANLSSPACGAGDSRYRGQAAIHGHCHRSIGQCGVWLGAVGHGTWHVHGAVL